MTPTEVARRSDALYEDNSGGMTRRTLCDMVAQREAEIAKLREPGARLFDKTLELVTENAKLREELDAAKHDLSLFSGELVASKFENAKLRELVADMYACISHANEQDWFHFERDKFGCGMSCTVNGEVCGLCVLADRMRELGVEEAE